MYEPPSITVLGPVFSSAGGVGEASNKLIDDVVVWDEEYYG